MKSIIYCFTGTGNSLHAAKEIKNNIENTEIVPMTKKEILSYHYDMIGFVFPVYFQGIPLAVRGFISGLDLKNNENAYIYAVATNGGVPGNSLSQINMLLENKNCYLSYGATPKMFSNYVVMYDMSKKIKKITQESDQRLSLVVREIAHQHIKKAGRAVSILEWYYNKRAAAVPFMDRHYVISKNCVGCGLCAEICPVSNIDMKERRPVFLNHCQQCMACIQYCPCKAINYKTKTQKRGRYHHPEISQNEMTAFYKGN